MHGIFPLPVDTGSAGVDLLPVHHVRSGRSGVRSGWHLCHPFSGGCSLPGPPSDPVGGGRGLGRVCMSGRLWRYVACVTHTVPLKVTNVETMYTEGLLFADE